jgi:arylsulfatase A-like enzyme
LERFFEALDKKVGEGEWTIFITSDHGAAAVPSHAASLGIPTDYWTPGNMQERIEGELDVRFGTKDWIQNISNNAIFLNPEAIKSAGISDQQIQRFVSKLCLQEKGIMQSIPAVDLPTIAAIDPIALCIYNGHKPGTSGDVLLVLNPGWMQYGRTGTTHGSPFAYDTHVPCLFYGAGVSPGSTYSRTYTRDIAPTISALLGIPYPNGTTGHPIGEALAK